MLASLSEKLHFDPEVRDRFKSCVVALRKLGSFYIELGKDEGRQHLREAFDQALKYRDRALTAAIAYDMGKAYCGADNSRDLDEAEKWFNSAREIVRKTDDDILGNAAAMLARIGNRRLVIAFSRPTRDRDEIVRIGEQIENYCQEAMRRLPDEGMGYSEYAVCLARIGMSDKALVYFRESLKRWDAAGDVLRAGQVRLNAAYILEEDSRHADALEFALAAKRDFEKIEPRASKEMSRVEALINGLVQPKKT